MPDGVTGAYWIPAEKVYFYLKAGGPTETPCDIKWINAFVSFEAKAIFLCPDPFFPGVIKAFKKKAYKTSLQPYKDGKNILKKLKTGDSLDSYYSLPGIILHEITHLLDPESGT